MSLESILNKIDGKLSDPSDIDERNSAAREAMVGIIRQGVQAGVIPKSIIEKVIHARVKNACKPLGILSPREEAVEISSVAISMSLLILTAFKTQDMEEDEAVEVFKKSRPIAAKATEFILREIDKIIPQKGQNTPCASQNS